MNWKELVLEIEKDWPWNDTVFIKVYNERSREYDVYQIGKVDMDKHIGHILLVAGDKINRFNL